MEQSTQINLLNSQAVAAERLESQESMRIQKELDHTKNSLQLKMARIEELTAQIDKLDLLAKNKDSLLDSVKSQTVRRLSKR